MYTSSSMFCTLLRHNRGLFPLALRSVKFGRPNSPTMAKYACLVSSQCRHDVHPQWRSLETRQLTAFNPGKLHSSQPFHSSVQLLQAAPPQSSAEHERLISQMNIRHVNENSFLSWCRNAYLSTVVGVAMMAEGLSGLAQSAGLGALMVGTMNLGWGTACHISNLIRLRHVSGMSGFTLFLHLSGSSLHFVLWAFVLICFIGFLDESQGFDEEGEELGDEEIRIRRIKGGKKSAD